MSQASLIIRNALKEYSSDESSFSLLVPELVLMPGSVCVVTGRSGCGKTTLLDVLGCISHFDGAEVHEMSVGGASYDLRQAASSVRVFLRRSAIAYVLQQGGLLNFLSVKDNLLLPMQLKRISNARRVLYELAERLAIADQLDKYPAALSIGQRQRVCIARALAVRPAFLLADEPTGALDPLVAKDVKELLLGMATEVGSTVIIVSHDTELFATDADTRLTYQLERTGNKTISVLVQSTVERRAAC